MREKINIGFISDLHTKHNEWYDNLTYNQWGWELEQKWKDMDLLIFAGDCSSRGSITDVDLFMNWFSLQPGEKVMISGNHDFFFDQNHRYEKRKRKFSKKISCLNHKFNKLLNRKKKHIS